MPSIALCHEWLAQRTGSEKTFVAMADALASADLFALTQDRSIDFGLGGRPVSTTFLDRLSPLAGRRALQLPLMPLAWRTASRDRYDLVVTSSHACVKGFWPARAALHLCYCYTPIRYAWLGDIDQRGAPPALAGMVSAGLRRWDRTSVGWVDEFAAISVAVRDRIARFYGRPSVVIHPPVDTDYFTLDPSAQPRRRFALAVSRMVPYKRLDLAIRACHALGYPLVVAGSGPGENDLRHLAERLGARVTFVVAPSDSRLRDLYRCARVLVFPAEEDFGIVPVEALACGTPVVAYGRGGAIDTVGCDEAGLLVPAQTADDFSAGIQTVLDRDLDPAACATWAGRFSIPRFQTEFSAWVASSAASRGIDTGAGLTIKRA